MAVSPGYIGYITVAGNNYLCSDANMGGTQEPLFYDHLYGLLDSGTGSGTKGEGSSVNPQKKYWRPGPNLYQGSASVTGLALKTQAAEAKEFGMELHYNCSGGVNFGKCKINHWTFSCAAGDIITTSFDVLGLEQTGGSASSVDAITACGVKTWRDVSIGLGSDANGVEVTINNNLIPIYTRATGADPKEIRVGMQEVRGSVTFYQSTAPSTLSEDTLTIGDGSTSMSINLFYIPERTTMGPSPATFTVPFVGRDIAVL